MKSNYFPGQVCKSNSKSLIKSIFKNSCLLLIRCALQMGGWQGMHPPARILRCLRCASTKCCELQPTSNLCRTNAHHFFKSPYPLGGWPSVSTGAGSCSPRALESCSAPWVQSQGSLVTPIHCPMHLTPGKLFLGQCLAQLCQSPGQEYGEGRLKTFPMFSSSRLLHAG